MFRDFIVFSLYFKISLSTPFGQQPITFPINIIVALVLVKTQLRSVWREEFSLNQNMARKGNPISVGVWKGLGIRVLLILSVLIVCYLFSLVLDFDFDLLLLNLNSSFLPHGLRTILRFFGFEIPLFLLVIVGSVVGSSLHMMDPAGGQPAANPAAEQPSNGSSGASTSGGEGAGGRGFRWTDLFGSGNTGNYSETGENSVNQPAPHSPEPEGDRGGPLIPEDPNGNHLISAQERMEELGHRLSLNSLSKNLTDKEWGSIVAAQITVEERVEVTLLNDGFSPDAVLNKRHQIRGFMFYPDGTSLTEKTYLNYVRSIDTSGTHASVPYKRVMQAIERHDLDLAGPD